jgi:hypothetical protein
MTVVATGNFCGSSKKKNDILVDGCCFHLQTYKNESLFKLNNKYLLDYFLQQI